MARHACARVVVLLVRYGRRRAAEVPRCRRLHAVGRQRPDGTDGEVELRYAGCLLRNPAHHGSIQRARGVLLSTACGCFCLPVRFACVRSGCHYSRQTSMLHSGEYRSKSRTESMPTSSLFTRRVEVCGIALCNAARRVACQGVTYIAVHYRLPFGSIASVHGWDRIGEPDRSFTWGLVRKCVFAHARKPALHARKESAHDPFVALRR